MGSRTLSITDSDRTTSTFLGAGRASPLARRSARFNRGSMADPGAAFVRFRTGCTHAPVPRRSGAGPARTNSAAIRSEAETPCIKAALPAAGTARSRTGARASAPLPLRFNRTNRHGGCRHTGGSARHRRKEGRAYQRARWRSVSGRLGHQFAPDEPTRS